MELIGNKNFFILLCSLLGCRFALCQTWTLDRYYPSSFFLEGQYTACPDSLIDFYKASSDKDIGYVRGLSEHFISPPIKTQLFIGEAIWLRTTLKNGTTDTARFLLEADLPEIIWEKVDIFLFDGDSLIRHIRAGKNVGPAQREIRDSRDFFEVGLTPRQELGCFVKFEGKTNNDNIVPPKLLHVDRNSLSEFESFTFSGFEKRKNRLIPEIDRYSFVKYSFEYVLDTGQDRSIDTIMENWDSLADYEDIDNYSHVEHYPFWARFKLSNPFYKPLRQFFLISGSSPKVEVYVRDWNGVLQKKITGKEVPLQERFIPHPLNIMEIEIPPRSERTVFMRYRPLNGNKSLTSGYGSGVIILDRDEFFEATRKAGLWKGFVLGVFIFQFIYFAFRAVLEKDGMGAYYACMLIGMICSFIYFENLGNSFLAGQIFLPYTDFIRTYGVIVGCTGIYFFAKKYLLLNRYLPNMLKVSKIFLWVFIVSYIVLNVQETLFGIYDDHFFANQLPISKMALMSIGGFFFSLMVMSIIGSIKKYPYAHTFLIAFSPSFIAIGSIAFYFAVTYQFPQIWHIDAMYICFMITNVLFAIVVSQRKKEMLVKEVRAEGLIRLNEAKSSFYDSITHEFRTPLTVIKGMTNRIKGHEKEKGLIQRNNQTLLNLVDHLMSFSKVQSTGASKKWIVDNIVPFFEYLMDTFRPLAKEKDIVLDSSYGNEEMILRFDLEKIKLIVNNLLSNALKFTPRKGRVSLRARILSGSLEICVEDTGIGLTNEQQAKVFEKYYQVSPNEENLSQIGGIGLAVTREQVEVLDGKIDVSSKFGEGSTFKVVIPLPQNGNGPEDGESPEFEFNEKDNLVLLVEDSPDVMYYLQRLLNDDYKVITGTNGKEGLETAFSIVPDIIISDVMMPDMDGYELTRRLKGDIRTSHIPIVLLTARSKGNDRLIGYEGGADAYIVKPFDEEELLLRIKKLIENRSRLKEVFTSGNNMPRSKKAIDPFIEKALGLLEKNFTDRSFGIDVFIDSMNLSRMQVHRKLKALTGLSTSQFINGFRLDKGKGLLMDNSLNISEVAYSCGYSDPGYFGKLFSKRYGMSPQEYRKSMDL